MTNAMVLSRWSQLGPERRRLLVAAIFTLAAASAVIALLPFRVAIRFGSRPIEGRASVSAADCVWAVEAAARRAPWRTVCIQKGLALQHLMRSRGVDALLHYGARQTPGSGKLEAHVWVSVGGENILGGEEAAGFAEVASYP